jgi:hypothetical protein
MEWLKFHGWLKANFGIRIESQEEMSVWMRFADEVLSLPALEEAAADLVNSYAEALNEQRVVKTPTLAQIRSAYSKYMKKQAEQQNLTAWGECQICRNAGLLRVLVGRDGSTPIDVRKPFAVGKLDVRVAPCSCRIGQSKAKGARFEWLQRNAFCGFALNEEDKFWEYIKINRGVENGD